MCNHSLIPIPKTWSRDVLGEYLAQVAEANHWPESLTTDNGERRGDIWVDTDYGFPIIEVTTVSDWETGGDWGSDPGTRRMVFFSSLPREACEYFMKLFQEQGGFKKLQIMLEDIDKYSKRLYGFKLQDMTALC